MSNPVVASTNFGQILRASSGTWLILIVAVYFYWLSMDIGPTPMGQLGAAFWPKMILIALILSCFIKFAEIVWNRDKLSEEAEARPVMDNVKLTLMIVLLLITVFAIDYIGFTLANFLFMLLFLILVGYTKPVPLILVSVLSTVALLFIFVKVVYLPLPKGISIFEDISLFVYRVLHIM